MRDTLHLLHFFIERRGRLLQPLALSTLPDPALPQGRRGAGEQGSRGAEVPGAGCRVSSEGRAPSRDGRTREQG